MEEKMDLKELAALNEALEYICSSQTDELSEENLAQLIVDGQLAQ